MRAASLCLCWFLLAPAFVFGQAGANASLPNDPLELYALMFRSNGLSTPDLPPWHIKVSYTVLDGQGGQPVDGIFEEWWRGRHRYKITYASAGFNQTEIGTDAGVYLEGDSDFPQGSLKLLRGLLLRPLPDPVVLKDLTPKIQSNSFGGVQLSCISLNYSHPYDFDAFSYDFPVYCLDKKGPVLRLGILPRNQQEAIYNKVILFEGHYLGGEMHLVSDKKPSLIATVDVIEKLNGPPDASFPTQPNAILKDSSALAVSSGTMAGFALLQVSPRYPQGAKEAGISGTVNLAVTIGKDGHIASLKALSGPFQLQKAAMDAVRHWIYQPYFFDGDPVEVETEIHVVFNLGR